MLLMDDSYDPDDILMDPDSLNEPGCGWEGTEELDFENPLFEIITLDEFSNQNETKTIGELFY